MINLGSHQLPVNAATKTFAILAKRGAGKTYTGAVFAEEFHKEGIPFIVFDPIDVWWGLKLSANGKSKGIPIVVFGLEHADIKINREMGRQIAQAVVKHNISCVISSFGMSKRDQRHLIAEFSDELLKINNSPRHVFIEEAHEYIPQRVMGEMGVCFNAVNSLIVMGRNRGIGVTILNQRASTVNKDSLTQIDTLIALRSVGPQDRKALSDWVEFQGAEGDFSKFIESLPTMPTGEGWIWSPEFLGIFERAKFRARETFHPDREKLEKFVMPNIEATDVQSFIHEFQTLQTKPLRGQVVKNEEQIKPSAEAKTVYKDNTGEVLLKQKYERDLIELKNHYESLIIDRDKELRNINESLAKIRSIVSVGGSIVSENVHTSSNVEMWIDKVGRNNVKGKILKFLSEKKGLSYTRGQLCLAIGISKGTLSNIFTSLSNNRLIIEEGGRVTIHPDL